MGWRERPIVICGCGGLGVPAAWTLALAGARELVLVDDDNVEPSNLHRQVLYREAEVGQAKASALAATLAGLAPGLRARSVCRRIGADGAAVDDVAALIAGAAAVVEATDDAAMKFAVSDAVAALAVRDPASAPIAVIAAAIGRRGQFFVQRPGGPCYRCLFEAPPPPALVASCRVAGVLGPVVGEVGAFAARSLVNVLDGRGDPAGAALLRLDKGAIARLPVEVAADCPHHRRAPIETR